MYREEFNPKITFARLCATQMRPTQSVDMFLGVQIAFLMCGFRRGSRGFAQQLDSLCNITGEIIRFGGLGVGSYLLKNCSCSVQMDENSMLLLRVLILHLKPFFAFFPLSLSKQVHPRPRSRRPAALTGLPLPPPLPLL